MYLQISPILGRCCVRLGVVGAIVGSAIAFGSTALAQVLPDNTLGSVVTDTGNNVDAISGGATRGANLFHSFQQFSVEGGRTAQFENGSSIQNIITRVTGNSMSDINGTIGARGAANLFLLNPNGIVFGQNARLDIGGSFVATTARSINFADGTQFSATPGSGAPLLTVSVPLGLQFGTGAGEIVNLASNQGLEVDTGKTLGLIGGNVNLEGGRLTARGGRIELGAVATPGVVGINPDPSGFRFSFPTDLALGDISLTNTALVDVRAGGGGSIAVNARNLSLSGGGAIVAGIFRERGSVGAIAGDIDINVRDAVTVEGVGRFPDGIFSSGIFNNVETSSTGKGGNINIKTGSLSLTDRGVISASIFGIGDTGNVNITARDGVSLDRSTIFGTVEATGRGNSGNINIKARSLSLNNGARINASTFGTGNVGNIVLQIDDFISQVNSDIFNNVEAGAVGNGGTIDIKASSLSLIDSAQIQALVRADSDRDSGGRGNGGKVIIDVRGSFNASGTDSSGRFPSGVRTTVGAGAVGNGGDIEIQARSLSLNDGAAISASTFGRGNAGNILLRVDDAISLSSSDIFSSVAAGAEGNSGTVDIKAGTLSLSEGAQIVAQLNDAEDDKPGGRGSGGKVIIDVSDTFSASGSSSDGVYSSGVFTTVGAGAEGKGGDIEIQARSLSLNDGARINASTLGRGNAGNILLRVDDAISLSSSDIFSSVAAGAEGNSGTIDIKAGTLSLSEGAQIVAQLDDAEDGKPGGRGSGGKVIIDVSDTFSASGSSSNGSFSGVFTTIGAGAEGKGGDIDLKARLLFLNDGARINASTFGIGNAGNVAIDIREQMDIDGFASGIFNNVEGEGRGQGGNINITTGSLFITNAGIITASNIGRQGDAGSVTIDARDTISIDGKEIDNRFGGVYSILEQSPDARGGQGGNIDITARSLSLSNDGQLSTSSFGQGNAGNITVDTRILNLDGGRIFASSELGNGGNIELQASKSVRLRNGSRISTSAGGEGQPGNGGNISITSPLVIAEFQGNNDIFANAFDGEGGEIKINAQAIFGLRIRTSQELQPELQSQFGTDTFTTNQLEQFLDVSLSNDVAAISLNNPSLSGTVSFNADYIDPSRDVVELPTGLVDASGLVAAGCPSGAENRFTVAGRGGLPPAPGDKLSPDALLTDWATLQTPETENRAAVETTAPAVANTTPTSIVEASSWQYDRNGGIILTSNDATASNSFEATPSCPSS